jgi:hypothetical protein
MTLTRSRAVVAAMASATAQVLPLEGAAIAAMASAMSQAQGMAQGRALPSDRALVAATDCYKALTQTKVAVLVLAAPRAVSWAEKTRSFHGSDRVASYSVIQQVRLLNFQLARLMDATHSAEGHRRPLQQSKYVTGWRRVGLH